MSKWVVSTITTIGVVLLLTQCSLGPSKNVAFTGTWKIDTENGITGSKESQTVIVIVDKNMFRIDSKDEEGEVITVYDGEILYEKSIPLTLPVNANSAAPTDDSQTPASSTVPANAPVHWEKMSEIQTGPRRFWARSFAGPSGPGGQIAGRETILYQSRDKRPDGEISVQGWVDAKTGIVLKSMEAVYSSQVDSMVSRVTHECQEINYGPADKTAFTRP